MISYYAYDLILQTGVINLKLENIISQDYHHSYYYARDVLKGRFELGEEAISKDWFHSFQYVLYILQGVLESRFRLGEEVMVKYMHSYYSFEYLVKVMRYNHE